jgi:hypothetical protein
VPVCLLSSLLSPDHSSLLTNQIAPAAKAAAPKAGTIEEDFQGCAAALKKAGKQPTIEHKANIDIVFTNFPKVCAVEAEEAKPNNGRIIEATATEITLHNPPAKLIAELGGKAQ